MSASFSVGLAEYLLRLRAGESGEAEYGVLLVSLLRGLISSLKCHDTSFKGNGRPGETTPFLFNGIQRLHRIKMEG